MISYKNREFHIVTYINYLDRLAQKVVYYLFLNKDKKYKKTGKNMIHIKVTKHCVDDNLLAIVTRNILRLKVISTFTIQNTAVKLLLIVVRLVQRFVVFASVAFKRIYHSFITLFVFTSNLHIKYFDDILSRYAKNDAQIKTINNIKDSCGLTLYAKIAKNDVIQTVKILVKSIFTSTFTFLVYINSIVKLSLMIDRLVQRFVVFASVALILKHTISHIQEKAGNF